MTLRADTPVCLLWDADRPELPFVNMDKNRRMNAHEGGLGGSPNPEAQTEKRPVIRVTIAR
ncbi:hypothetical protein FHW96_005174 [Novosphingobium sp. SG751A]|nr:hypothetical protein [Novosphingobium sp. SG751A]